MSIWHSHCQLCGAPFKKKKEHVHINGKWMYVCPNCCSAIARRQSKQAVDRLYGEDSQEEVVQMKRARQSSGLAGCVTVLIGIGFMFWLVQAGSNSSSTPTVTPSRATTKPITSSSQAVPAPDAIPATPLSEAPKPDPEPVEVQPMLPMKSVEPEPTPPAMRKNQISVSALEAHALYQLGINDKTKRVVFIDTRSAFRYQISHVKGACPLNPESLRGAGDPPQVAWLISLGPDVIYVLYCQNDGCNETDEITAKMADAGLPTPFIMRGGFSAWDDALYPVETGKHPMHDKLKFR